MRKLIPLTILPLLCLLGCGRNFAELYVKGQKEFNEKNFIEAVDVLNKAVQAWDKDDGPDQKASAYELLGRSYHSLRKIDKASEAFREALHASENNYGAAYELGMIYLTESKFDQASKTFKKALRVKENDAWALLGLGNSYFGMGNFRIAKMNYQQILKSSPAVKEAIEHLKITNQKLKKKKTKKKRK